MSETVLIDAIQKSMQHINVDTLKGRVIPLNCVFGDDGNWSLWIPDGNGGLMKVKGEPIESCYFGKRPARDSDVRLEFVEFLSQRANFRETHFITRAALSDVQNLATSLAKLELIFSVRQVWCGASRMAVTELEYIFLTCRSLFDVFQAVMVDLWRRIKLTEGTLKKRGFPASYRSMVMHDTKRMNVEEIIAKHQVPKQIAEAYHASSLFFEWLRQYRDYVSHSGRDFDGVYVCVKGFAVSIDAEPFSGMDIWCDANTLPNNLGSLKSAACHVILTTLDSLETIIQAFQSVITFPPPVAPDYQIFIRGPNLNQLAAMTDGVQPTPWYSSEVDPIKVAEPQN